jgi:hypothetical protein
VPWLAVAVGGVGGVGVGVEMDDAELPEAMVLGDGGGAGPGDRVIAADDQWDDPAPGDIGDAVVDGRVGDVPQAVGDERVTVVGDLEAVEYVQLEIEVIAAVDVHRGAQRPGPEARARPVGGAVVPRSADDGSVGAPLVELLGLG